jgi:DNA-binding NarL/FixJ family response regulator
VKWVRQVPRSLELLKKQGIAAVLLDLSLPARQSIENFDKLFTAAPDVPILIISGNKNEALAKQVVGRGAQGYLLTDHLDSYLSAPFLRVAF